MSHYSARAQWNTANARLANKPFDDLFADKKTTTLPGAFAPEMLTGVNTSVLITLFTERQDSKPIFCDHCHGVTIQTLHRTAEGREYRCECGEKTIYL